MTTRAIAQEPTEEPAEQVPVVVVQTEPAQEPEAQTDWGELIAIILAVAAAAGTIVNVLTKPDTRDMIRSYAERAEGFMWVLGATSSDVIEAFGGRRDVETSRDPAKLARALRDKDMHVLIRSDADFDEVINRYQGRL